MPSPLPSSRLEKVLYSLAVLLLVVGFVNYALPFLHTDWAVSSPNLPYFVTLCGAVLLLAAVSVTLVRMFRQDRPENDEDLDPMD